MDRHFFASTSLSAAQYDEEAQSLIVEFTSGAQYQYYGVPESVYSELITAVSAGRYFGANVRDHYACGRL